MGVPWKKILAVSTGILGVYVPQLGAAIGAIETAIPQLKGSDKKAAVQNIAAAAVQAIEGVADKDILNDAGVQAATSSFIDAYVALVKAVETAKAAKALVNPPVEPAPPAPPA